MEEKIHAIFDFTIKVMVPFILVFLAWTSFQIVETDRTQERVLQRLSDIEAKLLAMDGKVDDRWKGKDQMQLDKTTDARFDAVNNRLQRLEAYSRPTAEVIDEKEDNKTNITQDDVRMSWSTLISGIFKPAADLIGELHTSTEEKLEAQQKLQEIMNQAEIAVMEYGQKFEEEVTKHHENDMKSDSWLSKNIRPLGLIFAMVNLFLIAWATIFAQLTESQTGLAQVWIPLLVGMVGAMVGFYYSWRGAEKITKIRKS